jgi:hypothetical protein
MNKRTLVVILGIVVAIIPLLGLPGIWKKQIFVVLGIAIAYLAFSSGKRKIVPVQPIPEVKIEEPTSIEVAPMELNVETPIATPKPRSRRKPTVIASVDNNLIQ